MTNGDVGKEWRMLCPEAQMLLIADKPANDDMSVGARLSRKQAFSKILESQLHSEFSFVQTRAIVHTLWR